MTTFEPRDGGIKHISLENLNIPCDIGVKIPEEKGDHPCTLISGNWTERIKSGELLTVEELSLTRYDYLNELDKWVDKGRPKEEEPSWEHMLMKTIADKMTGDV